MKSSPTSRYKRGLFRIWIVATVALCVGCPIWLFERALKNTDSTCFDIKDITYQPGTEPAFDETAKAAGLPVYPITICTIPSDDWERNGLRTRWNDVTAIAVQFDSTNREPPVVLLGADLPTSYDMLEVRAITEFKRLVGKEIVGQFPTLEIIILVSMTAMWWIGRLVCAIGLWIGRGFQGA